MADAPRSPTAAVEPERPRDRYLLCLVLLLLSIVSFAAAGESATGRLGATTIKAATLLVILWSSRVHRAVLWSAAVFVVVAIAVTAGVTFVGGVEALGAPFVMTGVLSLLAPVAITRRLLDQGTITLSTVFGALCVYVLAGLLFASVYAAIQSFSDSGFFAQLEWGSTVDFVYFSFVTLATLGYGDLTPSGDLGRMLAVTQTVLGQLYLVAVVATLVGNVGRAFPRRATAE